MIIHCNYPGCLAQIEVNEDVSPKVGYTCRKHTGVGEDKVRFQESQFDPGIGSGADPKFYERGSGFKTTRGQRPEMSRINGRSEEARNRPTGSPKRFSERIIEKAKSELSGHENADKILKILREDIRDNNSGGNQE